MRQKCTACIIAGRQGSCLQSNAVSTASKWIINARRFANCVFSAALGTILRICTNVHFCNSITDRGTREAANPSLVFFFAGVQRGLIYLTFFTDAFIVVDFPDCGIYIVIRRGLLNCVREFGQQFHSRENYS